MDKEIKQAWVHALRSGDYKQGKHVLKSNDDRYCCAGVLCDILAKREMGNWEEDASIMEDKKEYYFGGSEYSLTKDVLEKIDVRNNPELQVKVNGSNHSIYFVNDVLDYNFNQIADLIEEQL